MNRCYVIWITSINSLLYQLKKSFENKLNRYLFKMCHFFRLHFCLLIYIQKGHIHAQITREKSNRKEILRNKEIMSTTNCHLHVFLAEMSMFLWSKFVFRNQTNLCPLVQANIFLVKCIKYLPESMSVALTVTTSVPIKTFSITSFE